MGLKLLTAPNEPAVSLATVKAQARIDYSQADQDAWLSGTVIPAVVARVEEYLGRRLVKQRWLLTLDRFPAERRGRLVLPYAGPLYVAAPDDQVEVKYLDGDGVQQTLATTEYQVRPYQEPAELFPAYAKSWPSTRGQPDAVEVRFSAGYGAAAAVPAPILEAICIHCATQVANREAAVTGTIATEIPLSAQWLLDPYRLVRWEE